MGKDRRDLLVNRRYLRLLKKYGRYEAGVLDELAAARGIEL